MRGSHYKRQMDHELYSKKLQICCICQITSKTAPSNVSFHLFPTSSLKETWIKTIKKDIPGFTITPQSTVCSYHFEELDLRLDKKNIRENAIPQVRYKNTRYVKENRIITDENVPVSAEELCPNFTESAEKEQEIKFEMLCRCCLTSDGTFTDMASANFQCHDQLLILGYKELIGEKSSLTTKDTRRSFICLECLEQLENAVSFRELCLQARRIWKKRLGEDDALQPEVADTVATVSEAIITTESSCSQMHGSEFEMDKNVKERVEKQSDPINPTNIIVSEKHFIDEFVDESYKIKCLLCDKLVRNYEELNQHALVHSSSAPTSKPFKCWYPRCSLEYKYEINLQRHAKFHRMSTKCRYCSMTFTDGRKLAKHSKLFHGMYPCDICYESFSECNLLFEHLFIHKDHNPYHCPSCGYDTNKLAAFKIHLGDHGIDYDEALHGYNAKMSYRLPKK